MKTINFLMVTFMVIGIVGLIIFAVMLLMGNQGHELVYPLLTAGVFIGLGLITRGIGWLRMRNCPFDGQLIV